VSDCLGMTPDIIALAKEAGKPPDKERAMGYFDCFKKAIKSSGDIENFG